MTADFEKLFRIANRERINAELRATIGIPLAGLFGALIGLAEVWS